MAILLGALPSANIMLKLLIDVGQMAELIQAHKLIIVGSSTVEALTILNGTQIVIIHSLALSIIYYSATKAMGTYAGVVGGPDTLPVNIHTAGDFSRCRRSTGSPRV